MVRVIEHYAEGGHEKGERWIIRKLSSLRKRPQPHKKQTNKQKKQHRVFVKIKEDSGEAHVGNALQFR